MEESGDGETQPPSREEEYQPQKQQTQQSETANESLSATTARTPEELQAALADLHPPRTKSEACRDSLLQFLDTPLVQGIGIVALILIIVDGAFFFFLLVGWHGMCDTPSRMECQPRNKWYNLSIQGLNILFTYMNTVSMPWRCTQLIHILGSCPPRENAVGHGLYGLPNNPDIWYWIPLNKRLGITIILLNNCIMQYVNQVTRIIYEDFESQNEYPGNLWTNIFFVASFACGGIGAAWMLYEMGKIRDELPGKFGPGPIDSIKAQWAEFRKKRLEQKTNTKTRQELQAAGLEAHEPVEPCHTCAEGSQRFYPDPTREPQRRSLVGKGEGRAGPRLFAM